MKLLFKKKREIGDYLNPWYIVMLALIFLVVTIAVNAIVYLYVNQHKDGHVFHAPLHDLKHWLNRYDSAFLDVNHPPINPIDDSRLSTADYQNALSTGAYPADIIAFAQVHLYCEWDKDTQISWDAFLFQNLIELEPYIKGMVQDYKDSTSSYTDDKITAVNTKLTPLLHKWAQSALDYSIDDNNAFTLKVATDHYNASKNQMK